jgi:hypothetical protein
VGRRQTPPVVAHEAVLPAQGTQPLLKHRSDTSTVNFISSTRGRVDASPEHPCPGFDGGTRVRTARTANNNVVRLYPGYWLGTIWMLFGMGYKVRVTSPTKGRGRYF